MEQKRWATAAEFQAYCAAQLRFFDRLPPKLREYYHNPESVPYPED